ncbi:MAG: hypothetical protein HW416_1043 [Chloroflexi bacterium]|nr:hypothetical protein [Chloroflexota bacterium]
MQGERDRPVSRKPGPTKRSAAAGRPRSVPAQFGGVLVRLPRYVRLTYAVVKDRRVPANKRLLALVGAAYAISPVDLVPVFIPVFCQIECMAALLLTVRHALRSAPEEVATAHLEGTGLTFSILDEDIATLRQTLIWAGVKSARVASTTVGRARSLLGRSASRVWILGRSGKVGPLPSEP